MPRIDVADDLGSWMQLCPDKGEGLIAFSQAVYGKTTLPMREREVARMRIAQLNECEVCRNARQGQGASNGVDEALYANAEQWRHYPGYSEREKLAAEFAERFVADHIAMRADDAFWMRLRAAYSDAEIVELGMCCALWLGAGRLQRILDVGQTCQLVL